MRQMADAGGDKIMLPVIDHHGNRLQRSGKGGEGLYRLLRHLLARRQHVVGVLDKMRLGVLIARLFGAGHGVPADKAAGKPKRLDFFVNIRLGAAHVRQQAGRRKQVFQRLQIAGVRGDGGAKIDQIAGGKFRPCGLAGLIHGPLPDRLLQRIPAAHIGQDPDIRVILLYGFGDGAADEAQADKSDGFDSHDDADTSFQLISV